MNISLNVQYRNPHLASWYNKKKGLNYSDASCMSTYTVKTSRVPRKNHLTRINYVENEISIVMKPNMKIVYMNA